jgi:Tfp pilus assembly protein PilF
VVLFVIRSQQRPDAQAAFPAPVEATLPPVAYDDFVGAQVCSDCHADQYAAWRTSTHGAAGGVPNPESVIAPFDGTPIPFSDAVVVPERTVDGVYQFVVRQDGFQSQTFEVDGVIGKGHMVGGGTQGFVSEYDDGTIRFLPWDYSRQEGVWFCNTGSRTEEGWLRISATMRLADCGDWPPNRVLGTVPRFANCQECHGSQIDVRFVPEDHRYRSRLTTYAVNCESCHGPGAAHVTRARAGTLDDTADLAIQAFGTEDKDASLEVCFQCHAVKDVLEPGYLPGQDLTEHYALRLSMLGEDLFFPDGRIRTFAYQQNHLASECYLNGSMTCVDCHAPHGQGYRDVFGRPLDNRFADEQCLSCHPSKAANITAHTHHPEQSAGSRCVSCHMPYLQHPLLGDDIRFARSDHTIPVPRPAFDAAMGIESACQQCHGDLSAEALQRHTDAWYGAIKPHEDIVTRLVAADTAPGSVPAESLLIATPRNPMAQMLGLDIVLDRHVDPDMPGVSDELRERLWSMADTTQDLDVRATALATMHLVAGDEPQTRGRLIDALRDAPRPEQLRARWVLVLGFAADRYRESGEVSRAVRTYRKALELHPDHAQVLTNLGVAYNAARNYTLAVETLHRAAAVDSTSPDIYVNLGLAYEGLGLTAETEDAYRRAIAIDPNLAVAHFNLANLYLRREAYQQAIEHYQRAIAADPGLARAHYYMARALILSGNLSSALPAARRALEFEPDNQGAREMIRDLEQALQNR